MHPRIRTLAFAAMTLGMALSAQATLIDFEELAEDALAAGPTAIGTPITLTNQIAGFTFAGATVYHVVQTLASSTPAPKDPTHKGFIQNRSASVGGTITPTISVALSGMYRDGDIEAISFNLANGQTEMKLWAIDDQDHATFFDFVAGGSWTWSQPLVASFANLGVIKRIEFSSVFTEGAFPAFGLDSLDFTLTGVGGGTVPEPAALGLVALALAAAGAASRRRRV